MDSNHLGQEEIAVIQKKSLRVLSGAQTLSGLGVSGTFAAGSLLVVQITGSDALAGLVQTATVVGAALLALPLAKWTTLGGRRRALSTGYFVGGLGATFALIGGVNNLFFMILIGASMIGGASAAGYQARFGAIDLATDENRARDLSLVVWASTVGSVLGPNLMEPAGALAQSLGFPRLVGPYIVSIFTLTLAATLILIFLKPDPYLLARTEADVDVTQKAVKTRAAFKIVRSEPKALLGLTSVVIGHIAMVTIMVMTPVHMGHVDVALRLIGLVISVHVLGMYAFSPLIGKLTDQIGREKTIIIGALILLLAALVSGMAYADAVFQLGIGLFLLGLGWSMTMIAGSTLLAESVPLEGKAASQGLSDLLMNGGGALGGAIAGLIIAFLSYGWLCALVTLPVAFLLFKAVGQVRLLNA
jgi:MFS family permease